LLIFVFQFETSNRKISDWRDAIMLIDRRRLIQGSAALAAVSALPSIGMSAPMVIPSPEPQCLAETRAMAITLRQNAIDEAKKLCPTIIHMIRHRHFKGPEEIRLAGECSKYFWAVWGKMIDIRPEEYGTCELVDAISRAFQEPYGLLTFNHWEVSHMIDNKIRPHADRYYAHYLTTRAQA
jgi:hypothetical protein